MAAFTLAHLSDPHLPPMPVARFRDLAGKRALGYLNWTRNRHKYHRREVLDALVSDLRAQQPDHVAVTGDLVNLALEAEFAPSRAWLESVGTAEHVTVIPGNHDAYVRATSHRAAEAWDDYLRGDEANGAVFPFLRRRGPVALIGVSSAVPTAPLMATGRLGHVQLEALDRILAQLSTAEVFRVLLVHHPLHSTARVKRLTNSRKVHALLRKYGVELVLHGHDHIHSTMWFEGPAPHPRDRRAVGLRDRAPALSGRRLQPVFDRARQRRLALPADRAQRRWRYAGEGNSQGAIDLTARHCEEPRIARSAPDDRLRDEQSGVPPRLWIAPSPAMTRQVPDSSTLRTPQSRTARRRRG